MPPKLPAAVADFYRLALTVNLETEPGAALERCLAADFRSVNGQEIKDRATLARQLAFFWKLIPDLRWTPADVVSEGNRFVVRSVATGSPKGDFMGVACDGTKTFRIDTIDIHTVVDGKVAEVYHLEDWATAIRQLSG
ncbi:MAG: ester cyclase [Chloroflexi bacterium]|nr:ester cyclase [Chloroflexota bacterium]